MRKFKFQTIKYGQRRKKLRHVYIYLSIHSSIHLYLYRQIRSVIDFVLYPWFDEKSEMTAMQFLFEWNFIKSHFKANGNGFTHTFPHLIITR